MEDQQWTVETEMPGSQFDPLLMNTSSAPLHAPLTEAFPTPSVGNSLYPPPDLYFDDFGGWDQQQPLNGFYNWDQPQVQGACPTSPLSFASNMSGVSGGYAGDTDGGVSKDTYSHTPYAHSSNGESAVSERQYLKFEPELTSKTARSARTSPSARLAPKASRRGGPKKYQIVSAKSAREAKPKKKYDRRSAPKRTAGSTVSTGGAKRSIITSTTVEGSLGTRFTVECSAGDDCVYRSKCPTYTVSKDPHKQSQSRTTLIQQDPDGPKSKVPAPFHAIVDGYRCATKILDSHPELDPTEIAYICVGCLDKPCTHIVGSYHSLEKTEPTRCKHDAHLKRKAAKDAKAAQLAAVDTDIVGSFEASLPPQGEVWNDTTGYEQMDEGINFDF